MYPGVPRYMLPDMHAPTLMRALLVVSVALAAAVTACKSKTPPKPGSATAKARDASTSAAPRDAATQQPNATEAPSPAEKATPPGPRLVAVGPRLISNETDYPLWVYGQGFAEGATVKVGDQTLQTHVVDAGHLTAVMPASRTPYPQNAAAADKTVTVVDKDGKPLPGTATLTVVDDANFPTPYAMVATSDGTLVIASPTTDELWWLAPNKPPTAMRAKDRPRGLALYRPEGGKEQVVVAYEFTRLLELYDASTRKRVSAIKVPRGSQDLVVDSGNHRAYVTNHVSDTVEVVDLKKGARLEGDAIATGPNPRPVALSADGTLLVGNMSAGDVSLGKPGAPMARVWPTVKTSIVGGPTAPFQKRIMGGKSARAVAWVERADGGPVGLVASVGPNVGPNPERMDASMNGGIGVLEPKAKAFVRHVSAGHCVPGDLAVDVKQGLAYLACVSTGRVVAYDLGKLLDSDTTAKSAVLGDVKILPPKGTRLIRPAKEFEGTHKRPRTGKELHSGPKALALMPGNKELAVLNRLSSTVSVVDITKASKGTLTVTRTLTIPRPDTQRTRRLGETLFYTDYGQSQMSCDGCHPDGHDEGVFFTKGNLVRIYRSPSLRGARETAPYFTPIRFPTMKAMAHKILTWNRRNNPAPDKREVMALAMYSEMLVPLPNPHLSPVDGKPPARLDLPRAKAEKRPQAGNPVAGMKAFIDKDCVSCHPAPQFTLDQDMATRGKLLDVGTPILMPLRPQMQDAKPKVAPIPSLVGIWDNYPLLLSGAAGFEVQADKTSVAATDPFPLRTLLTDQRVGGGAKHGKITTFSRQEVNDVLAYLLTL